MHKNKMLFPVASLSILLFSIGTSAQTSAQYNYYFAHLASGGIWRTTLTYVNPGQSFVTCNTSFYSNTGAPLRLTFGGVTTPVLLNNIPADGTIHSQTDAQPASTVQTGWALCQCNGPIKASILFRSYNGTQPQAEGSVLGASSPASRFLTYSDQITGIAYANPQLTASTVTFTARNLAGQTLATKSISLAGLNHGSFNTAQFMDTGTFQGSMEVTSSSPIISLALNFEASPVFSSLPPGQDDSQSDFPIPITTTDKVEIQGDDGQYLGLVSYLEKSDLASVFNPLGSYGNAFSRTCILNIYGDYGSTSSNLSAFNEGATRPPILLINGVAVAKVTTNRTLKDAIDPWYLLGYIRGQNL
jgi:hypothetical protein